MKQRVKRQWFRNLKIATRIMIVSTASVVITAVVISAIALIEFTDHSVKTYNQIVGASAKTLSNEIDDYKISALETAQSLAQDKEISTAVKQKDEQALLAFLQGVLKRVGCDFITITDAKGTVILRVHEPDKKGDSLASQKNISAALRGEAAAYVEKGTEIKLSARASAPLKDADNKVFGVVSTGYRLDNPAFLDELKKEYTTDFTIFLGDERINTTVMQNGKRMIGTKASKEVADKVLTQKQSYYGTANVLGEKFISAYTPIFDGSNQVVGIIFSGISSKTQSASTRFAVVSIMVALVVLVLLSILIIYLITRRTISKPIKSIIAIADKLAVGDVEVTVDAASKDEIGALMVSFANIVSNTKENSVYAQKIAEGHLDFEIIEKSEKDILSISMQKVVTNLRTLTSDINKLSDAAVEGRLDVRADSDRQSGEYRHIVEGVNHTLDAIVQPLNVAMEYIAKMAKGEVVQPIENQYNGDYYNFIDNLNRFRETLYDVLGEISQVTSAAKAGNLSYRADAGSLNGGFKGIVQGVNDILDEIMNPIEEASKVLEEMEKGNLQTSMQGNYKGDHAKIKNALNGTISALSDYIGEIARVLNEVAHGNLDTSIDSEFRGDFIVIKNSLNNAVSSFNDTLVEISNASDQVATGARQVSDAGQALSQGATEQAGSVEQLSASIAEIAQQTKKNAALARQSDELGKKTQKDALSGNSQMNDMLDSMNSINESSKNISKIIKVIDDIAFQTNILALNAAVEAARAGQYGKGFAVVAEEVRNLAARSASAAKETTDLIENSIVGVEEGTKRAVKTAEHLKDIIKEIEESASLIEGIATSSDEQAAAIIQIDKGIEQVSQVIQTNSATAEESAASSEELSSQAEFLKQMVGKFNFKSEENKSDTYSVQQAMKSSEDFDSREANENQAKSKPKIILNDMEFGKY
ncbi:MAG: tap1 [Oscillospiraceae bacterium]|nr:tap1 [Oscillospiraceae bacterium]